jgi:peroxiredoxin
MALKIGSTAPDFTLKTKTADGLEDVTLSKNFGVKPTVLLFFPFAYTGVCTDEMCDKTGGIAAFRDLNAEVYGISVTLLSDLDKKVITAYDVVFPQIAGIGDASARAAIVIDQAGKVVYAEQTPTPKDLPDFEAVKAVLAKLP